MKKKPIGHSKSPHHYPLTLPFMTKFFILIADKKFIGPREHNMMKKLNSILLLA
jgi:hypothetical protein